MHLSVALQQRGRHHVLWHVRPCFAQRPPASDTQRQEEAAVVVHRARVGPASRVQRIPRVCRPHLVRARHSLLHHHGEPHCNDPPMAHERYLRPSPPDCVQIDSACVVAGQRAVCGVCVQRLPLRACHCLGQAVVRKCVCHGRHRQAPRRQRYRHIALVRKRRSRHHPCRRLDVATCRVLHPVVLTVRVRCKPERHCPRLRHSCRRAHSHLVCICAAHRQRCCCAQLQECLQLHCCLVFF